MKHVYLVTHVHEFAGGEEDVKFIGVYATERDAEAAVGRAKNLPGFRDSQEGFWIECYELGKDHWCEGFVTWVPDQ